MILKRPCCRSHLEQESPRRIWGAAVLGRRRVRVASPPEGAGDLVQCRPARCSRRACTGWSERGNAALARLTCRFSETPSRRALAGDANPVSIGHRPRAA